MGNNHVSDSFYVQVAQDLGIQPTSTVIQFFQNWHIQEVSVNNHGPDTYNPFNTTYIAPGTESNPLSGNPNGNHGHPVQVYSSEQAGIAATVATLRQYPSIVNPLKTGDTTSAAKALVSSSWGTTGIEDPITKQVFEKSASGGTTSKSTGGNTWLGDVGHGASEGASAATNALLGLWGGVLGQVAKIGLGVLLLLIGTAVLLQSNKAIQTAEKASMR